jgi:Ca2+-binding RTX toxin-like protein
MADNKTVRAKEALDSVTVGASGEDLLIPDIALSEAFDTDVLGGEWTAGSDLLGEDPAEGSEEAGDEGDEDGASGSAGDPLSDGDEDDDGDEGGDVLTAGSDDASGGGDAGDGGSFDFTDSEGDHGDSHGGFGAEPSGFGGGSPAPSTPAPASSGGGSSFEAHVTSADHGGFESNQGNTPAFVELLAGMAGKAFLKEGSKDAFLKEGSSDDDEIDGTGDSDIIRGGKGEDLIDGNGGDDWLIGGNDDDILDGGSGSDIVSGGKGDDILNLDLSENYDAEDSYDGGKGTDTLVLHMTEEQFNAFQDDLIDLKDWIAENADPSGSSSHGFHDESDGSEKYKLELEDDDLGIDFELNVRNVENLKIFVAGIDGEIDPVEGLPTDDTPPPPDIIIDPPTDPTPGKDLTGTDGADLMIGGEGDDTLDGAGGSDLFLGGTGDDTLTGGAGNDLFIFRTGDGQDTITDFEGGTEGGDIIDLRQMTAAASFSGVMAAAAQIGGDVFVDFGGGDSLTLLGVQLTDLDAGDFLF